MVTINQTTNIQGVVTIEKEGEKVQVAYVNASISAANSNVSINKTITNAEEFATNKEEVLADFDAFEKHVYDSVGN